MRRTLIPGNLPKVANFWLSPFTSMAMVFVGSWQELLRAVSR
jgi:hypothetical protein